MMTSYHIPFLSIIEADHAYLSALATQILRPNLSVSEINGLLVEITWRLVRHDVSEELVMRPAFATWLGREGVVMGEHDREEHSKIKESLGQVWHEVTKFRDSVQKQHRRGDTHINGDGEPMDTKEFRRIVQELLRPLLREMKGHMDEESGRQLPVLADVVGKEVGYALGDQYVRTLLLGLDADIPVQEHTEGNEIEAKHRKWTKCFDGLEQYMTTGSDWFCEVLDLLREEEDAVRLTHRLEDELTKFGFRHDASSKAWTLHKHDSKLKTRL